jgi:GntR family transcriptional regulator / MocR family aminotransferase
MTTLHLRIDESAGVPIHRQIYEGLRRAILEGVLRPGQQIPSTRSLAMQLAVSRQPVLSAYEQLLHEGYLGSRAGAGTFVGPTPPDELLWSVPPSGSGGRATMTGQSDRPSLQVRDEGGLGPFRISVPALDRFPHAVWAKLVARHAHTALHDHMAYGDPAGVAGLRAAIAEHLRTARAVTCEAGQVLVVSGSQAALRLAAAVLLQPGDRVAVEEPGYPGGRAALAEGGAEVVSVPMDEEGVSVASLQTYAGPVRAAYVTPSRHYPLGTLMSAGRRQALLEWASRADAWILEDDYDSEFRYADRPLGAIQGMDTRGRVIYIGTFSKALFPAIRVGYLVVPPSLWPRFVEAREAFDLFSPTLYQLALSDFLLEGHFSRHLRRMRVVYRNRRDALLDGLRRHCGRHLTVLNAGAGLHIAALLKGDVDDQDVVGRMKRRGLTATALSSCYAGPDRPNGLLLGFGGSTERRLLDATQALADVLKDGR